MQEPLDERILSLVPKEGRKKAAERLKQLERDITEMEKKKIALDYMSQVSRDRVSFEE